MVNACVSYDSARCISGCTLFIIQMRKMRRSMLRSHAKHLLARNSLKGVLFMSMQCECDQHLFHDYTYLLRLPTFGSMWPKLCLSSGRSWTPAWCSHRWSHASPSWTTIRTLTSGSSHRKPPWVSSNFIFGTLISVRFDGNCFNKVHQNHV